MKNILVYNTTSQDTTKALEIVKEYFQEDVAEYLGVPIEVDLHSVKLAGFKPKYQNGGKGKYAIHYDTLYELEKTVPSTYDAFVIFYDPEWPRDPYNGSTRAISINGRNVAEICRRRSYGMSYDNSLAQDLIHELGHLFGYSAQRAGFEFTDVLDATPFLYDSVTEKFIEKVDTNWLRRRKRGRDEGDVLSVPFHKNGKVYRSIFYYKNDKMYDYDSNYFRMWDQLKPYFASLSWRKSILEKMLELAKEALRITYQLMTLKPSIHQMALAMKQKEGWYAPGDHPDYPEGSLTFRTNNPGALRWSYYQTGTLDTKTNGVFAVFDTYEKGFEALLHQIRIVVKGTSPTYTREAKQRGYESCSELSLKDFFEVYAPNRDNNNSLAYAEFVAGELGVDIDYQVKNLRV